MKSIKTVLLGLAVGLGLGLSAHAQNISVATGGTGGVYYPMGGGLAAALSKYVPGMQATAEVTGGSVDNLKLIGTGKPYVGFSMSDAALDAYEGQDKFKAGGKVPVRTLMVLDDVGRWWAKSRENGAWHYYDATTDSWLPDAPPVMTSTLWMAAAGIVLTSTASVASPVKPGARPATTPSRVDLPTPVGPARTTSSPASIRRSTPSRTGAAPSS